METGPGGLKRRVQPIECASVHYVCEQIEDSIQRHHRAIELFKEWKADSEADLQHYREAHYLSESKDKLIKSSEESVGRHKNLIAEYEEDVNRLLEILQEAKTLEKHILSFWAEKDKEGGGKNGT